MPHICYIYIIFRRLTRKSNEIEEKKNIVKPMKSKRDGLSVTQKV